MRPNIRVEIQNNLAEAMEVDENEEGEISDKDEPQSPVQPPPKSNQETLGKSLRATFTTGINILDKKEQEKLQERARRFQLNPEEIRNFTDEDLQLLHASLGITPANESNTNFEVIHMRGIEQMNASDILDYFIEYAPDSVQWISEETCNVVWIDKVSATRALHYLSKPVRGMPVRDDSSYFGNIEVTDDDTSILLKDREIELQEDVTPTSSKFNEQNSVDISEITSVIPPGYWRLGNKHPKSKCLLLRFALKTDQKPFKSEQFSRYYKLQGKKNPKVVDQGIFGRNKDMTRNVDNPWGVLAKNWDEDEKFREKERKPVVEEPEIEIKNPNLKQRLGSKRKNVDLDSEPVEKPKKVKIPRMRMYADEEEEKIKRKKMLARINQQIQKIDDKSKTDLREMLSVSRPAKTTEEPKAKDFDLGSTLKNRNRKMVFEIKTERTEETRKESKTTRRRSPERSHRRDYSEEEDEGSYNKPKSKVAVVIRKQQRPTVASAVASTVKSRIGRREESESESEEEESSSASSSSESSSSSEEEEQEPVTKKLTERPGFGSHLKERVVDHKSPLKIEISNDHFKRS